MTKSKIAKTWDKQQCRAGQSDHISIINRTNIEASDAGATIIELIMTTVIAGILLMSVAGMIAMAIRTFSTQNTNTSNPHRITQHALARTAERMMIIEECANPSGVEDHTECLERAEISFPEPVPTADWPGVYSFTNGDLCWMVDSRDIDDNQKRPALFTGSTNKDFRDLECWDHDPDEGTITVHAHHPATTTSDTSTKYKPTWNSGPYRSSYITNRIERLGYCTRDDAPATGISSVTGIPDKTTCDTKNTGTNPHTWHSPWGCVEGINTDPRSGVTDTIPISGVTEQTCDHTFTNGVAVLILRVCVSMTPTELGRRSNADIWTDHPLTCNGKNIVVTPGRQ